MIAVGEVSVAIAGGVESMTRAPYSMPKGEEAFPRNAPTVYDTTLGWRYPNPRMAKRFDLISMGETAENVATKFGITREEQDEFSLASHQKAIAAWEQGAFEQEIAPVPIPQRKADPILFDRDEAPRPDASIAALAKLRPVFREGGTVTAGNSSPLNDGAAAVMLASESAVKELGLTPKMRWVASATAGVDPSYMGEGPIPATRKLLARTGLRSPNLDVIELNEAFAAQSIACIRGLDLDPTRVNTRGGAIALGHPIGCSGSRVLTTLVHALHDRKQKRGIAALCLGGGNAVAMAVEAV
jgi:acetyl-CoA acetyltransferase family protein